MMNHDKLSVGRITQLTNHAPERIDASKLKAAKLCECERGSLRVDIYYKDSKCEVCGGMIRSNYAVRDYE